MVMMIAAFCSNVSVPSAALAAASAVQLYISISFVCTAVMNESSSALSDISANSQLKTEVVEKRLVLKSETDFHN